MRPKIAIIYSQPDYKRRSVCKESKAELSIVYMVRDIYHALIEQGYPVVKIPLSPPLELARDKLRKLKADVVFNLFAGFDGYPETEADIAYALSELGVTYTGCNGDSLSLSLDKAKTKTILEAAGIETPSYQLLSPETLHEFHLNYPCIVKPDGEDASHGLNEESVVYDSDHLEKQVLKVIGAFGGKALVEEFVDGREFNISVIGNRELTTLPITEITYSLPPDKPQILTFAAKWDKQSMYFRHTKPVCPADIDSELRSKIETIALSAFKILNCSGYARIDFRMARDKRVKVLELNSNPDISPDAGIVLQAKAAGMKYNELIDKIVLLAVERAEPVLL